ncbi:MAG: efflux RND transporter permease subunit [Burkholderiales bacterium]|jgi:HAE1 family hydrophobic/amphiphilic exporter-1|nr:efflux RND transporter permease subunit [Burkholderiales bacterium]
MTLPQLSIKRYVFAIMLNAVIVLFGVIAYQRIGVDKLPYIEFPVISVQTTMKGANPEVIDASITNLLETAVNGVPGIEDITSTSSPGVSQINITFNLDKKIDVAFSEVQAKVNQVLRRLPKDADPPVVAKVETNASPILWLALQGDRTQQQLNTYAINTIKKQLETIDGVGEVRVGGRRDRTIRVELQPSRMAAFGITAQDINEAFAREHLQVSGGFIVGKRTESLVKIDLEFHKLAELENLIVTHREGAPVRLKDIAAISDGLADNRQLARYNGRATVSLGIVKIANTNTVEIIERVRERLDREVVPALPPGLEISIVSNDALFIREIIDALKDHLLEGTLLAAIVVWLFLRSFRSTLIVATAIPVSLMGAVAVMYFFGYSFNSVTGLALLLLIGVVVDDAIVVLENIFRHREVLDPDPMSAAINGSNEVAFAVIAASLSLVSIFAPVIFLGGMVGQFFKSFAVVVTFGVLVSLFVALTLTPVLCSRFLKVAHAGQHGRIDRALERAFGALESAYRRLLALSLRYRWAVLGLAALVTVTSIPFFKAVPKELAPAQDEGRFLIFLRAPLGSSIEYTESKLRAVEELVDERYPEVVSEFGVIGLGSSNQVNQATLVIRMRSLAERRSGKMRSQHEVIDALRRELSQVPGVRAFAAAFGIVPGQRNEPLQFVVSGPNLQEMGRIAGDLQRKLQADPTIGRLDSDLQLDLPQLILEPDRERAAALGLTSADIALAVNMVSGGVDIAKYNDEPGDGQRYDIRVKAADGEVSQPADLSKIYLRNRAGQLIRLESVARFKETIGPAVVAHYNQQYSATFRGTPSVPLGDAIAKVEEAAKDMMPPGYSVRFIGQAKELGRTAAGMAFAFGLALALLYMVLASQFNSFVQPLIIMLAVPLAIIGGVFALWLSQPLAQVGALLGKTWSIQTLNIYSMIGLVLLIGLVAKNSILLVDLTNQRRAQGMGIDEALADACPIRMRPVLMTSLTIILALMPAALGLGAGAETNGPLAVAVIGGMVTSTLLTLVVVPAAYSLVESRDVLKPIARFLPARLRPRAQA